MSKKDQLFRVIAALDNHFAADDQSPADVDRWRELRRHITRMKERQSGRQRGGTDAQLRLLQE
jgi:hypothetical protein